MQFTRRFTRFWMILGCLTLSVAAWSQVPGDIDDDDRVDDDDIDLLVEHILGDDTLSGGELSRADMNLDTLVDVADLVSMLINVQAIAGAPLQLSVIASQDPVRPSEFLQYLLTVTNTTRTDFPDVVLENTLPEDITVGNPDSPTSGGAFNDGQTFFWNLGTLPAGESRSRGFTTQVNGGSFAPPDGTVLLDVGHAFDSTGREATTEAAVTVKATNDLTLRISADKGVAGWGDELTYLIVYGNRSATTSLNTSLIVTLPEHVEFESATGGGSLVGSEVQWNLESITPGATAHQQFTVNVPQLRSGAQLVATASITGSDSRMAESTVSTPVRGNSPLDLTMAMSHDPIRPGEMLHTVLTVTNRGNSELPNVTLRNTMGGRVGVANPDTATSGGGTSDGQTFFWNLGNLPAGASETRGYTHLVDGGAFSPPEGTVIRTTARVVDDAGNEDFAVADIRVETSDDLTLLMSADKRPVQPGEVLTFALNFGNRSAGTSTGTAMSASVPEGTSFLSATGGGTHVGEEVQWDLGSLAPGENGVRRFKVTVIPGLAAGRQVASIAEIENGARSQSAQTKCFVPVQVNPPLNVSVVFSPNPVRPSGILNVLLTASNQGAGDFTDVELAHTLPAGVGSASVDTSPVTGQIGDGDTFRWNLGTLAVGQSVTRGYTLLVDGGAFSRPEGTLQRHFTRLHEPLGSEAMDQTDVRIEHDEDLMMRVRTNRGPVAPGETLKHTVDFTNRGSSTLTFVELRAQVPEGSTFVSASDNGLLVGDQVEWNIGTLEAGAGNQRRFTVTVDGDAEDGDHMVSLAEISDGSGDHSGEAKAATPVLSESPFVLSMALSQDPQRPGEVMHALMTLTNRGTLDLPDVVLRHTLPQHSGSVKLDEAHSGGSLVDAGTFFWELGTLGAGRSVTRGFSYLVDGGAFSPPEGTLLWHVARASNSIGNEANALAGVRIDATDDLSLRIAADHAPAAPAEELTFALTYTNRGASEVSGVTLRAPVPEGTAFSSATGGGVLSNGEVAWTLGAVGSGQGGKVEYTVTVDSGLGDGQQVNAFAELNGAGGALGSQANCDVPVRDAAPLALAMTASADPASPAATVTYNLTVSNVSASELVDVVLRVTLPNHIGSGAAGTPVSGGTVNDTNTFFWNLGSIPATTDVMRSFSFVIDGGAFTPPPGTMLRVSARVDDAVGNEAIKQLDIRVE